jgi:flagellar assembly protein FliH
MSSKIIRSAGKDSANITRFNFKSTPSSAAPPSSNVPQETPAPPVKPAGPEFSDPSNVQQQCELMLLQARNKVSEIEKEAYEIGFAQGQKAGAEVGEKMVESLLKQYAASLEELNKLRKDVFASSEHEVIRLALEIAKKIIKREVAIDEELILTLVKVALSRVADQALITVRVNPKDYRAIERHQSSRADGGALSETVKLIEDPLVGRGGCLIETDSGTIDARIDDQLREIEKGFFE